MTTACFNEQTNEVVWSEAISQAHDMIRYWSSKSEILSTADDTRTLSLHVLSRAGFGKTFPFQGHDERQTMSSPHQRVDAGKNYKDSLQEVLDNCVLIMALGTKFLAKPWLPRKLRRVHEACVTFQQYMTDMYEQQKRQDQSLKKNKNGIVEKSRESSNLMAALVRASQKEEEEEVEESSLSAIGGLIEAEIYGNMFVFNFAGHDTTAHTLTFIFYFLATAPDVQEWLGEEINQVFGERCSRESEWVYSADFPRLRRCLAVLMETVRLYTPVPVAKWTGSEYRTLNVSGKAITIPPETMVLPSYAALHTHPRFWGSDSLRWRPSRWITTASSAEGVKERLMVPERGSFIGWSEGERSCPGKKFTQVETVATLATIFQRWRVEPAKRRGESIEGARARVLHQIQNDSHVVLLLQMLHPERAPLVWKRA
jgi:cytochrome P450